MGLSPCLNFGWVNFALAMRQHFIGLVNKPR